MISASAGHCPLLLASPGADKAAPAQSGFPLGIEAGTGYHQTVNALPPDAAALLYTDGLSEARNSAGEQFGEQSLRQAFAEAVSQTRDAHEARDHLLRRLADFRGPAPLTDDQTLILIRHIA
jgi:sigma-B regulation protein RsbU (phosphoserine phosphatase)